MGCEPERVVAYRLGGEYLTLSSAVYPEGIAPVRRVVLALVDEQYDCDEPLRGLRGYVREGDLVFITAARRYGLFEAEWGRAFISAGLGGTGASAGRTINVAVFVNQGLNVNGLVSLLTTITEAKCGALRDLGLPYTGTVSDAAAAGSPGGNAWFAGTATDVGRMAAELVRRKVREMIGEELATGPGER